MKTIIGAIALVIAAPAAAQAAGEHDAHTEHQQAGHQEGAGHHDGHDGHAGHKMDCCKDCCGEKMQEGKKDCCAAHREKGGDQQDHSAHGH